MTTILSNPLHDTGGTRFDEYQLLIDRIRQAAEQLIPEGSTVLVVSKGDPALLALGRRTAWHFPRAAAGQYAGFHPANSAEAIARLDVQRGLGARYLLIPGTSAWWLRHYPEFVTHLRSCGRPVLEDPSIAWIFELTARTANLPSAVSTTGPSPEAQQLIDLLQAVLPSTATITFIASRDNEFVPNSPVPAFAFRYSDDPAIDVGEAIRDLRRLAGEIADYLVVPNSSREWLMGQKRLASYVDETYRLVTDQRNVCKIYDLRPGVRGAA